MRLKPDQILALVLLGVIAFALVGCSRNGLGGYEPAFPKIFRN